MDGIRKYYEAYDDRYRQVHSENLRWFAKTPSPILSEVIAKFRISKDAEFLELGCGEGRDANVLLSQGYRLLATDISQEAVSYCQKQNPNFRENFRVLDCVCGQLNKKFDFIYAIAVLHMLVEDADRSAMLRFICEHMTANGMALICTMGDGVQERSTDISAAFDLQARIHEETGKNICIAGTSYRSVSFENFEKELMASGLEIIDLGLTDIKPDYWKMMYAVVRKR